MASLQGKIAIVTGATGGIGKSIAAKLAAEGATVVVNGRNASAGNAVVAEIRERGGNAVFLSGDVLSWSEMQKLASDTVAQFGHIDILVASAGGDPLPPKGPERDQLMSFFPKIDPDVVAQVVARATSAKLNPARAAVESMVARNSGAILFLTTEGGRFPTPGQTAASIFAGGLIMMTKVVAKELSRSRIRVNTIAITLVEDTPAWESFVAGEGGVRVSNFTKIMGKAPFGLAKPKDIAEVAAFLVSDSAAFITGATVSPTGGITYS